MKIKTRASELNPKIMIAPLSGKLGVREAEDLGATLSDVLSKSATGVVLDMSQVRFVGSGGLRAFMLAYREAANAGKKMAMIRVQPAVYKIFKLTTFDALFRIFEDEAAAVKAIGETGTKS